MWKQNILRANIHVLAEVFGIISRIRRSPLREAHRWFTLRFGSWQEMCFLTTRTLSNSCVNTDFEMGRVQGTVFIQTGVVFGWKRHSNANSVWINKCSLEVCSMDVSYKKEDSSLLERETFCSLVSRLSCCYGFSVNSSLSWSYWGSFCLNTRTKDSMGHWIWSWVVLLVSSVYLRTRSMLRYTLLCLVCPKQSLFSRVFSLESSSFYCWQRRAFGFSICLMRHWETKSFTKVQTLSRVNIRTWILLIIINGLTLHSLDYIQISFCVGLAYIRYFIQYFSESCHSVCFDFECFPLCSWFCSLWALFENAQDMASVVGITVMRQLFLQTQHFSWRECIWNWNSSCCCAWIYLFSSL